MNIVSSKLLINAAVLLYLMVLLMIQLRFSHLAKNFVSMVEIVLWLDLMMVQSKTFSVTAAWMK